MENPEESMEIQDIYHILGRIDGKLDGLVNGQNGLVDAQSKTIYALIALAGATIGLKLMGTPPLAVIARYINTFAFLFAMILAAGRRKYLIDGWRWIFLFGLFGFLGNVYNIVYQDTAWVRTALFIVANGSLVVFLWRSDKWR